jgi:two-component system NtrC family response regulator
MLTESRAATMERSVLVVDDEENLLVLLERILSKEGFLVRTASNAYQALDLVDKNSFDLAILDIKMFPVDGVALLSEIKKRSPSVHVVMITAYPTVDTRNECLKIGASTYLTKPLDIQELKSVVQNLAGA